jgi:hypothetical protein
MTAHWLLSHISLLPSLATSSVPAGPFDMLHIFLALAVPAHARPDKGVEARPGSLIPHDNHFICSWTHSTNTQGTPAFACTVPAAVLLQCSKQMRQHLLHLWGECQYPLISSCHVQMTQASYHTFQHHHSKSMGGCPAAQGFANSSSNLLMAGSFGGNRLPLVESSAGKTTAGCCCNACLCIAPYPS